MNRLISRLVSLGLLLLYILPVSYFLAESFGCRLDGAVPFWIALLCVTAWIAADFRFGAFIGLPASALVLYLAYRGYDGLLAEQISDAFDRIVGAYYEHFYAVGRSYGYAGGTEDHSLVFIFLAFLLASYLSTALTSNRGRILFSLAGSVPPFIFGISVTGEPSPGLIFCLLLFWALLLASGSRYDPAGPGSRAVLITLLPSALALALLLVIFGPDSYTPRKDSETQLRYEQFRQFINRFSDRFLDWSSLPAETQQLSSTGAPSDGAPALFGSDGGMDLSGPYDFGGMDREVLQARAETGGTVYLRAVSYGDYTGTGWEAPEETGLPSSLPYAAYAAASMGAPVRQLDIRLTGGAGEHLLLPYFSSQTQSGDACLSLDGLREYTARYVQLEADPSQVSLPEAYLSEESRYRSYAHDIYTRLPQETREAALAYLADNGLSAGAPDLVEAVAAHVRSAAEYDLSTSGYPSDDYALYFLTQAKRGYCIHFATAAAVLYRALGIPARVTEGFVFTASPGEYTPVLRADAHAWVELYYDGLGWIPVEVTGMSNRAGQEEAETSQPTEESPQPTSPPEQGQEPPEATGAPVPSQPGPSEEPTFVGVAPSEPPEEASPSGESLRALWAALRVVLPIALAVAFVPAQRALRLSALDRRCRQPDRRKAAVTLWKTARSVSAYGGEVPRELTRCAEKAAFSNHDISPEELSACRALLNDLTAAVYARLSPVKKFVFKYLCCLK